jgi:lincosamide nucleotidyltransferase A/C/D/E
MPTSERASLLRQAYHLVRRSPLSGLLDLPAVDRARLRFAGMTAHEVVRIVGCLEASAVAVFVFGGWGVDALAGKQTRRHLDLDLAYDAGPGADLERTIEQLGYRVVVRETVPNAVFPHRLLVEDPRGRQVDLHPVVIADHADPGSVQQRAEIGLCWPHDGPQTAPPLAVFQPEDLARGAIGRRSVRCLSATRQLAARSGYDLRETDHDDIRLLQTYLRSSDG